MSGRSERVLVEIIEGQEAEKQVSLRLGNLTSDLMYVNTRDEDCDVCRNPDATVDTFLCDTCDRHFCAACRDVEDCTEYDSAGKWCCDKTVCAGCALRLEHRQIISDDKDCELPVFGESGQYLPIFDETGQFVPGTDENTDVWFNFLCPKHKLRGGQRDAKEAPLNAWHFIRSQSEAEEEDEMMMKCQTEEEKKALHLARQEAVKAAVRGAATGSTGGSGGAQAEEEEEEKEDWETEEEWETDDEEASKTEIDTLKEEKKNLEDENKQIDTLKEEKKNLEDENKQLKEQLEAAEKAARCSH